MTRIDTSFEGSPTRSPPGLARAHAYEQERQRAEALAEIDRVKTTFFSNVSHELRTPLTLMLGPLEEVLPEADERLGPERYEQLLTVRRNTLRLLKLVNTLLDFSRIEAGRVQAVYQPTDLATFTAEIASGFRSAMESAGLRLFQPNNSSGCSNDFIASRVLPPGLMKARGSDWRSFKNSSNCTVAVSGWRAPLAWALRSR
jgi:signal transduction histidine kinase